MVFPIQMLRFRSLNIGQVIFSASGLYINKFAKYGHVGIVSGPGYQMLKPIRGF